jgi:excisionase family DNA binding protein
MSEMPKWFRVAIASAHYDIPRSTLYAMIADGRIKAYRVGDSRSLRIRREDIERLFHPIDDTPLKNTQLI